MSKEILSKIKEKNKILKRICKCKNLVRKSELQLQFKALKNEITFLTRSGKKEYYKNYFSENKDNLQKVWKGIKEIINIKSKNFDSPTCLQDGDVNITDPIAISNRPGGMCVSVYISAHKWPHDFSEAHTCIFYENCIFFIRSCATKMRRGFCRGYYLG